MTDTIKKIKKFLLEEEKFLTLFKKKQNNEYYTFYKKYNESKTLFVTLNKFSTKVTIYFEFNIDSNISTEILYTTYSINFIEFKKIIKENEKSFIDEPLVNCLLNNKSTPEKYSYDKRKDVELIKGKI